jgi:beta-glucosidase
MEYAKHFTKDFLFGAAAASYQIEGAVAEDGKGPSIWDTFSHTPGRIKPGHNGDVACDHYHRSAEDVALMKKLGLKAYRFSFSWPRILPEGRGRVNEKGIDFYSRLIDDLLAEGITPFATMFHWDLPQTLQDEYGGFARRRIVEDFGDYAELLVRRFGDRIKHWITLNEPWVYTFLGNFFGVHAPGHNNPWTAFRTMHNLLLSHGEAVRRVRQVDESAQVGITLNLMPIYPEGEGARDRRAAQEADLFINGLFLDPLLKGSYPPGIWKKMWAIRPRIHPGDMELIGEKIDFLGINNYSRGIARYRALRPFFKFDVPALEIPDREFEKEGVQFTSMGWEVFPEGLYELLIRIRDRYDNLPVYITENGAAFEDTLENGSIHDSKRTAFLQLYIDQVGRALAEGCNVKGYFVWSLMDNFEWAEGYDKRFGIVYVDYADGQKRIVKDSGLWYRDFVKSVTNRSR